jgi:uncharacterized iron-regulated membrane protein
LVLDGVEGRVLSRKEFRDRKLLDRIIGTGVAAHEGQLFGWPNQLMGVLTALGLITLCVSALTMWWKRRIMGVLGAPAALQAARFSWGLAILAIVFGVLLPLMGISMLAVLMLERYVLRKIPRASAFLGLQSI